MAALGLSLVPVLVFLAALHLLDTYRLLTPRRIALPVAAGAAVAIVLFPLNSAAFARFGAGYARWGAPVIEELLKAAYVFWCLRTHRIGFPVDAAITGFAVGAGFAVVENLSYLWLLPEGGPLVWLVRGFGTAMMHGAATAIAAVIAVTLAGRAGSAPWAVALAPALAIHLFHNSGLLLPLVMTQVILVILPIALALIFRRSERLLAEWLAGRLDQDIEVLGMIESGEFLASRPGRYLQSLRNSFAPEAVGDMFCLLRASIELRAQAKGDLLRRELGFEPEPDPALPGKLREVAYLERSIGRAGLMALAPLLPAGSREMWEQQRMARARR